MVNVHFIILTFSVNFFCMLLEQTNKSRCSRCTCSQFFLSLTNPNVGITKYYQKYAMSVYIFFIMVDGVFEIFNQITIQDYYVNFDKSTVYKFHQLYFNSRCNVRCHFKKIFRIICPETQWQKKCYKPFK